MPDADEKQAQLSAGEQLRHLREQKNFSVQDVATRLNLEARIIEAIEDNNFEVLPAATYARGYLRSYSKLLDIDAEIILSAYNDDAPAPPEIIPEVRHPTQTSSSDKPVRAFTYLVSLTLVILLVAWLYSTYVINNNPGSPERVTESADTVPPGLGYEIPVVEHSTLPFYRVPEEIEDALVITNDSVVATDPEGVTDQQPANDASDSDDDDYPLNVTTDNEGPDSLTLRLSADSWIEIFDAPGNKVFVNLGREGQVIELRGTAPFQVLLGFSEGVSVEINGEAFDAAPYTSGSIARFTLDR